MALGRLEGETPEWAHPARDLRAQGAPQPRGLTGRSLLLVVVAGTGSPTPDLTAELLYQLWVLLLHLLSELLAPAGGSRGGVPGLSQVQGTHPATSPHLTCPWREGGPLPGGRGPREHPGILDPAPPRSPAWQVHSRLDETGQVILRGAGAGSPQGVVAARNHAGHAAKRVLDLKTVQPPFPPAALLDPSPLLARDVPWDTTPPEPTLLTVTCQFHQLFQERLFFT